MKLDFYYAADQDGQRKVFLSPPERAYRTGLGYWSGDYSVTTAFFLSVLSERGLRLPRITWDDNPVVIRIKTKVL